MKNYENVIVKILVFQNEDIITASNDNDNVGDMPTFGG